MTHLIGDLYRQYSGGTEDFTIRLNRALSIATSRCVRKSDVWF